jgi:hypothetical protein
MKGAIQICARSFAPDACGALWRPSAQLLSSGSASAPLIPARTAGKVNRNWIGCRLAFRHSTRFRSERERLPRFCRSTKKVGAGFFFASQLGVRQPLSHDALHRIHKSLSIVMLALVESERLFIEIAEQVERLNADVRSLQTALQERPEVFNSVRVYVALNLRFRVIDHLMNYSRSKP